jgi:hypothetical protein
VAEQVTTLGGVDRSSLACFAGRLRVRVESVQREQAVADAEAQRRELLGESETAEGVSVSLDPGQARLRLESVRVEAAGNAARLAQGREASEAARLELERARERAAAARAARDEQRKLLVEAEARGHDAEEAMLAAQRVEATASEEAAGAQRALEAHQQRVAEYHAKVAVAEARLQQEQDSPETDVGSLLEQAVARGDLKGWHGRLSQSMRPAGVAIIRAALSALPKPSGWARPKPFNGCGRSAMG